MRFRSSLAGGSVGVEPSDAMFAEYDPEEPGQA
jgi:hypothetical protein